MYKQGEIVLIPVPFSDLSSTKRRPVLVISSNEYNDMTEDIIVMAVTSNITNKKYCINIDEIIENELPQKSQIRADKIYTLSKALIIKKICVVSDKLIKHAIKQFNEILK